MRRILRRLLRVVPDWPRQRFNVFAGTNTRRDWLRAGADLVRRNHADETLIGAYERAFARQAGCKYAFSFGAGRMGLYALLRALGMNRGDQIIVPAYTCVVVPNAMIYQGLEPVYVDIDPVTFNMDPDLVEGAITDRTKAIYLQHTFGVSARAEAISAIAQSHGLDVIEDAAHSLGGTLAGRRHGSLGQVAFFSTDRTKVINTHLGGMVTTNDEELAGVLSTVQSNTPFLASSRVRRILLTFMAEYLLYSPAILWAGRPLMGALRRSGLLFYWRDELLQRLPDHYPYPCRLSSSQARLGESQLRELPGNLEHRRRIAKWLEDRVGWYGNALSGAFEEQVWLRYSFLVRDRDEFERRFSDRFDLAVWFTSVLYGRQTDLHLVGYRSGSCPVAEKVARHIVNLPTHPRIPLGMIAKAWSRNESWLHDQVLRPPLRIE